MYKIKNLEDLVNVLVKKIDQLSEVHDYLSEAGLAAEEAYKNVCWYAGFHDTIESLSQDEDFKDLVNIPDKHPEYYRLLRIINRVIDRTVNKEVL